MYEAGWIAFLVDWWIGGQRFAMSSNGTSPSGEAKIDDNAAVLPLEEFMNDDVFSTIADHGGLQLATSEEKDEIMDRLMAADDIPFGIDAILNNNENESSLEPSTPHALHMPSLEVKDHERTTATLDDLNVGANLSHVAAPKQMVQTEETAFNAGGSRSNVEINRDDAGEPSPKRRRSTTEEKISGSVSASAGAITKNSNQSSLAQNSETEMCFQCRQKKQNQANLKGDDVIEKKREIQSTDSKLGEYTSKECQRGSIKNDKENEIKSKDGKRGSYTCHECSKGNIVIGNKGHTPSLCPYKVYHCKFCSSYRKQCIQCTNECPEGHITGFKEQILLMKDGRCPNGLECKNVRTVETITDINGLNFGLCMTSTSSTITEADEQSQVQKIYRNEKYEETTGDNEMLPGENYVALKAVFAEAKVAQD